MKRDMDLVRKILLEMEEDDFNALSDIRIEGYTPEQIGFHSYIMAQAGLIESIDATCMSDLMPNHMPRTLTWDGYEFIASVKDPTTWEKAKKTVLLPAGGLVFSVVKERAKMELKAKIGMP
jgi:hypothetical protein